MKILVTCDSLDNILKFEKVSINFKNQFKEIHYLIKSNRKLFFLKTIRFLLKIFLRNFKLKDNGLKFIFSVIKSRRLKLITSFNDPSLLDYMRSKKFDIGFHAMGVIYPEDFLNSFKYGVLNSHIGKLPEMRGRSVFEWSLILKIPTGITCFFMDSGIDTGKRIVSFKQISFAKHISLYDAKLSLFEMDKITYFMALKNLKNENYETNKIELGKRYYQMSFMLLECVKKSFNKL